MPANWSTYNSSVGTFLDTAVPKTEQDTAKFLAQSYLTSILPAGITMIPGSTIISPAPLMEMETAIANTFLGIKTAQRRHIPSDYTPWAVSISNFWLTTKWNPLPPAPGYVAPTLGVTTLLGGDVGSLTNGLYTAFNNPPVNSKMGRIIAGKLVTAFTTHLTTVNGQYIGLIPSPTGPVPGPPFPWVGIV